MFGIFRDNKVSVDVVATSEISISLTLDPRCWPPHTCLACQSFSHEVHVCPMWAYVIKQSQRLLDLVKYITIVVHGMKVGA